MNGSRFLLDTNAIIELLKGNSKLQSTLSKADWIGASVISVIEFLAFPNLSQNDSQLLLLLLGRIEIVDIQKHDISFIKKIAALKTNSKLKIPDAIIAASAIENNAILVTNDKDFINLPVLAVYNFIHEQL